MVVLKFGGSSVANAANINAVINILKEKNKEHKLIVFVLSALGGITDALHKAAVLAQAGDESYQQVLREVEQRHLKLVNELLPVEQRSECLTNVKLLCNEISSFCKGVYLLKELSPRATDAIISYGEILSTSIFCARLDELGITNTWKDTRELLCTNSDFGKAIVDFEATQNRMDDYFGNKQEGIFVLPGFIAGDKSGQTTTLGRGGSDYTAAIIGRTCNAASVEIWTDVSGIMTADPSLVSAAKKIEQISYGEVMELSHFGAKILYAQTIQPLVSKNIPVVVKNTFHPDDPGTTIGDFPLQDDNYIRGISSRSNIALISLEGSGMAGIPGFSKRLFEALAMHRINVILITQSSSEYSVCVGIEEGLAEKAREEVNDMFAYEIATQQVKELVVETSLSIIALVGDRMKNHPGISGRMLSALGRNGVNVRAIAQGSTERNISVVVAAQDVKKAVNVLHEDFFENTGKKIHLFIVGAGNVGSKLMAQLKGQAAALEEQLNLRICLAGLSNSRKMALGDNCIPLEHWEDHLAQGQPANWDRFVSVAIESNLRNSILVDVTANKMMAQSYDQFLQNSIAIVACNKIAASADYAAYSRLKELSREYQVPFFFETNVGAGLPVIGTLNDLIRSGDRIKSMEAVLSGTLNYVFNNYDGSSSFASVVRQAQDEGYTEPDPRLDLSGTDVMRKILILARESGAVLEMEQIENEPFLPSSCLEGDVENFYRELEKSEPYFKSLIEQPVQEGKKLKYIATYNKGKASVGLKTIGAENDFFNLFGKDNAVLFFTNRYSEQPLVIKGAGAGADVTASGVFADILRAART